MIHVRRADILDLEALVALERESFSSNQLSSRGYRRLLTRPSATVLVADVAGKLAGAAILLFRSSTSIARLYSLSVARTARGRGVARTLLEEVEQSALERGCALLRLEVRVRNVAARRLYASAGFIPIEPLKGYYGDGIDGVRLERSLWNAPVGDARRFRYYAQTLDFTCGAAALMMAMGALSPSMKLDRRLEIRLWREATTVFMTSGHGGCGPFGLALAARARGFRAVVHAPSIGPMFVDSVRDSDKKRVIALVEEDFIDQLASTDVTLRRGEFGVDALIGHLRRGEVPVVLISLFRLHGEKGPHWVTVTGYDGHVFRVLDPMSPPLPHRAPEISIARREFERMSRYGRQRQAAAVILSSNSKVS